MTCDEREKRIEAGIATIPSSSEPPASLRDFYALKKEFQEFRGIMEEREKLKERFSNERLTYVALLIASWGITIGAIAKQLGLV